jgi:hypothetical protein
MHRCTARLSLIRFLAASPCALKRLANALANLTGMVDKR